MTARLLKSLKDPLLGRKNASKERKVEGAVKPLLLMRSMVLSKPPPMPLRRCEERFPAARCDHGAVQIKNALWDFGREDSKRRLDDVWRLNRHPRLVEP